MFQIAPATSPQAICEVLGSALPHEEIDRDRFSKQVLLDPNFDPAGSLLARIEGKPVGYVLALARRVPLENAPMDSGRGYITLLGTAPSHRGHGIGSALLQAAEAFLREKNSSSVLISPYAPGYFFPGVDIDRYAAGLDFFKRRAYEEVYRPIAMETSLEELQVPAWVDERAREQDARGIRILPYKDTLTRPLIEFTERCFPGDWVRVVRDAMRRIFEKAAPHDRLHLALDDQNQVIGFSHYEAERFGPIGVDPDRRGQGIGQVLMYQTLRRQQAHGYDRAWFMWSDDNTAARLYEGAGFKISRRFALLKKDLQ